MIDEFEQLVLEACCSLANLGEIDYALAITNALGKKALDKIGLTSWPCLKTTLQYIYGVTGNSELSDKLAKAEFDSGTDA